jgi:L-rhamnose mutarotase
MATKADFSEAEWQAMQRGVTGSGMLVSVADQDFTDAFGESSALARYLSTQRTTGTTELMRELGATRGTGFGLTSRPEEVRAGTLEALRSTVATLQAKAPDEVEPYRALVLGAATAVAQAKGGVKPTEEAAIAAIREALGATADPEAPAEARPPTAADGTAANDAGPATALEDSATAAESAPTTLVRRAFTMRLKPGALAEYTRQHDAIWPELVAEIERQGIGQITIFELDPMLVLYSECRDMEAFDRLWHTAVHERWGEVMAQLMDYDEDGIVSTKPLREIWHLETAALAADG